MGFVVPTAESRRGGCSGEVLSWELPQENGSEHKQRGKQGAACACANLDPTDKCLSAHITCGPFGATRASTRSANDTEGHSWRTLDKCFSSQLVVAPEWGSPSPGSHRHVLVSSGSRLSLHPLPASALWTVYLINIRRIFFPCTSRRSSRPVTNFFFFFRCYDHWMGMVILSAHSCWDMAHGVEHATLIVTRDTWRQSLTFIRNPFCL